MDYFITKDKTLRGFKYKRLKSLAWSFFPDSVKTQKDMRAYLDYGRNPDTSLIFLDSKNEETVFFSISINKGTAIENFDPGKRILIEDEAFMSVEEQVNYLKQFSDCESDNEISDTEKLNLYKRKANASTLEALKALITERKTPENVKQLCQEHVLKYNKGRKVIIEFE